MLQDARALPAGSLLEADVCVVGAGPAGIALARRLAERGRSVVLLESGGFRLTVRAQRLGRGETAGQPYWPLASSRFRLFGGAANRWGGMCRPLDPIDLEERDWVAGSGWPIGYAELAPHLADAARFLGLPQPEFDPAAFVGPDRPAADLEGWDFENVLYQFSPTAMTFGAAYEQSVTGSPTTTLLTHATVTGLALEPGTDRVRRVVVTRPDRTHVTVSAHSFVLAAGAIENARLLLASRSDRPAGLGNEHDQVGRHFMEHLHVPVGHALVGDGTLGSAFYQHVDLDRAGVRGALATTAAAQRRHRLLTASVMLSEPNETFGQAFLSLPPEVTVYAERALRRAESLVVRGTGRPVLRNAASRAWQAGRAARARTDRRTARRTHAGDGTLRSVYLRGEPVPDPRSRVTLRSRCDRLGMPRARLDWRLTEQDQESVERWTASLGSALEASGLGRLYPASGDWRTRIEGGPHQMGTTRMSRDPRDGVVDADGRVHSVDNLWVAGASVFPTGGYANPTLTLVALSLRLGDHLATVSAS